ncbi:MAG TPA: tRNA lysidine(34) synthetase TilS, partial [bacterium]
MLRAFLAHAGRHGLLPPGARVIAALSGGADSTCLLHLLLEARAPLGLQIEVAHVNHRLRGRAAERDAAAVERLARRNGLPFHLGLGRPFTAAERRSASLQELARELRLGFLLRLARRRRARVALAHTADDQAETLLMRMLGGAGPPGLCGIPPASHGGLLVHPLLCARRAEIEAWLAERGLRWRTDRSNRSPRYLRNRVRHELLPLIARDYNPAIVGHLDRLARALRLDNDALEAEASRLLREAIATPGVRSFPAGLLDSAPRAVAARALLAALRALAPRRADFSSRHLEALLAPGSGERSWDLPGGVSARRDGAG